MIKPMTEPILTVKIAQHVLSKVGILGNPTSITKNKVVGHRFIRINYTCLFTKEKGFTKLIESKYLEYQTEYCNLVLDARKCPFN
jgi:hypothetical protein